MYINYQRYLSQAFSCLAIHVASCTAPHKSVLANKYLLSARLKLPALLCTKLCRALLYRKVWFVQDIILAVHFASFGNENSNSSPKIGGSVGLSWLVELSLVLVPGRLRYHTLIHTSAWGSPLSYWSNVDGMNPTVSFHTVSPPLHHLAKRLANKGFLASPFWRLLRWHKFLRNIEWGLAVSFSFGALLQLPARPEISSNHYWNAKKRRLSELLWDKSACPQPGERTPSDNRIWSLFQEAWATPQPP